MTPSKLKKALCLVSLLTLSHSVYALTFDEFTNEIGTKIKYFFNLVRGDEGGTLIGKLINAEWINLEYTVINKSSDTQHIMLKDNHPIFMNNFNDKWIRIIPEAVVPYAVMQHGQELQPIKDQGASIYKLGTLQYYYHTYATNVTTVQFQVITNTPVKTRRDCILKFHIKSKGPQLNSYLNVISDPENKKYENTCVPYIEEDPEVLKQNCGWFWCERPQDKNFAKVNIVVLPPKVAMAKLVPACQKAQSSKFPDYVFIYPDSTNPKEMARTEQRYDIQPRQPVCPGGTWVIELPADFQFKKFEFNFIKPAHVVQPQSLYKIDHDHELTGWPELREIKNPITCVYDHPDKKPCRSEIAATAQRGQTAVMKTPGNQSVKISLRNNALFDNMIPVFSAWSVTPYDKKRMPPPVIRNSPVFDRHIKK